VADLRGPQTAESITGLAGDDDSARLQIADTLRVRCRWEVAVRRPNLTGFYRNSGRSSPATTCHR